MSKSPLATWVSDDASLSVATEDQMDLCAGQDEGLHDLPVWLQCFFHRASMLLDYICSLTCSWDLTVLDACSLAYHQCPSAVSHSV